MKHNEKADGRSPTAAGNERLARQYDERAAELYSAGETQEAERLFAESQALKGHVEPMDLAQIEETLLDGSSVQDWLKAKLEEVRTVLGPDSAALERRQDVLDCISGGNDLVGVRQQLLDSGYPEEAQAVQNGLDEMDVLVAGHEERVRDARAYELQYLDVLQGSHSELRATLGADPGTADHVSFEQATQVGPDQLDVLIKDAKQRFATDLSRLASAYDQRAAELYTAGETEEAERLFAKARHLGLPSELKTEQERADFDKEMLARWQTTSPEPLTREERRRINDDLQARFESGSSIQAVGAPERSAPESQSWLQRRLASVRQGRENSPSFGMSIDR